MKFIVDTHLPPVLAKFLRNRGFHAIHTTYFPNGEHLSDAAIRRTAVAEERTVVTKDADFYEYFMANGAPPKVLFLQFGNIKNRDLLALFEKHWPEIVEQFEDGADLVIFERFRLTAY